MNTDRRNFVKTAGTSLAGAVAFASLPSFGWSQSPVSGDRISVALIGCRNMGFGVLKHFLSQAGTECAALCDIDETILNKRAAEVQNEFNQTPKLYKDFRSVLEQKDIDAVIIGTPDHWHCLIMVYALQAGKDVYVEKPLGNSIEECNIMARAAEHYDKRIVQVGQQQRSGFVFQKAIEFLNGGRIGNLRKINMWANFSYGLGPIPVPDSPVPQGVDYDMWLGPAPDRPFNQNRFHGSWRHFWDYGSGMASDWGVHLVDIGLWAGGDIAAPVEALVYADNTYGGEKRARETFDSMNICFPRENFVINYDVTAGPQRGPWDMLYGIAFVGDDATMVVDRKSLTVFPEYDNNLKAFRAEEYKYVEGQETHGEHVANFIDCIRTRKTPACTPQMGRAAAIHMHIANIAGRVGEPVLIWDESKNKFTNSRAATQFIKPEYRKPWALPKI